MDAPERRALLRAHRPPIAVASATFARDERADRRRDGARFHAQVTAPPVMAPPAEALLTGTPLTGTPQQVTRRLRVRKATASVPARIKVAVRSGSPWAQSKGKARAGTARAETLARLVQHSHLIMTMTSSSTGSLNPKRSAALPAE